MSAILQLAKPGACRKLTTCTECFQIALGKKGVGMCVAGSAVESSVT